MVPLDEERDCGRETEAQQLQPAAENVRGKGGPRVVWRRLRIVSSSL